MASEPEAELLWAQIATHSKCAPLLMSWTLLAHKCLSSSFVACLASQPMGIALHISLIVSL